MLMFIGKWEIHLHIWFYDVSVAFHIWYIAIAHVRGSTLILEKWHRHIMFWHLHLPSWCKHCEIVCIHLSWKWVHICTNGVAMYGLLSIIETFGFDMFVFEGKLRQCDSNILCFDIWIRIQDANIVFSHVNVFCLFGDISSHMVLQCMECNQELIHWDLTCSCCNPNCVSVTQTYSVLTCACEFMMLTLSFSM